MEFNGSPDATDTFLNGRVVVIVGDITRQSVDAIVNAANAALRGGGGVDAAIHAAGGPQILAECKEIRRTRFPRGLPTGEAVVTTGGALRARYVVHTVGPIKGMHGSEGATLLASCYNNSLALAVGLGCKSVAVPSISTGVYGYPKDQAAVVSSTAIAAFLTQNETLKEVRLVFFSDRDAQVFRKNHTFCSARQRPAG
jgi:O-acetyl-ADP-ribose deacetylase (regulator of RNase III)